MDSTKIMEEVRFSPEDEIFSENTIDDSAIYIITKGKVDICFQPINFLGSKVISKTYSTLKNNTPLGEISFFTGKIRTATAISNGFTKLFKIKRKDFLLIL